ncbi:MAG: hypothetical protein AAGF95_31855 [Chloroflexota bacterium]
MARIRYQHLFGGLLASTLVILSVIQHRTITQYLSSGTCSFAGGIFPCTLEEVLFWLTLGYVYLWWIWVLPMLGLVVLYRHTLLYVVQHHRLQIAWASLLIGAPGLVWFLWSFPPGNGPHNPFDLFMITAMYVVATGWFWAILIVLYIRWYRARRHTTYAPSDR